MYGVSEETILRTWSLETLVKKVKHGWNFELIKAGSPPVQDKDSDEDAPMTDMELLRLYENSENGRT